MTALEAALAHVRKGREVLPIFTPDAAGRCDCGDPECKHPGKHPRIARGVHGASRSEDQVRGWWSRWPDANVGVRTGGEGGIAVLDVDGEEGIKSLLGRDLPFTTIIESGRGYHYVFSVPEAGRWPTRVGILPKVDLIADCGYIIVPPSRHVSGRRYGYYLENPLSKAPPWLSELVRGPGCPVRLVRKDFFVEGERNDQLFRRGCGFARNIGMTRTRLLNWLLAVNRKRCAPPLAVEEVAQIATNVERTVRRVGGWGSGRR